MTNLFLKFTVLVSVIAAASIANADITSGTISSSGVIAIDNVSRAFNYGVEIDSTVSGTVGSPTAVLQGSIDGVDYFNLPIKATGDATKSVSLSTSGTFYLGETNVDANYIRVYYSGVSGGGSLIIQQSPKTHNAIY